MSKVLVTESYLGNIANAIRLKNGAATTYRPGDMAAAIQALDTSGIHPTGTKQIATNGTHDVTQYASANVNVQPNLQSKTVTENGTVTPDQGYDGLSSVVVNVSGGGDVTLLTRSEWDALTIAQKQALGLVAIQDTNTGFKRGILVYGADYEPVGIYLPYSDEDKVICEAYVSNFVGGDTWGYGNTPITLMSGLNPSKDTSENAIYMPCSANSPQCAFVDLGASGTHFTAYVVMRLVNPGNYTRILSAMHQRSAGQGMLLYGSNINVGSWANDTPTGILSSGYFAAALQYSGSGLGVVHGGSVITKTPTTAGRYVTIARTDPDSNGTNAEPGNAFVRYMAVVNEAEDQATVIANLANLANEFLS